MEEGYHRGIESATHSFWNQLIIYQSIDSFISLVSFIAAAYFKKIGYVTGGIVSLIIALVSSALVSVLFNAYHFRKTSKTLIMILSKTCAITNSQKKLAVDDENGQKTPQLCGKLTDPTAIKNQKLSVVKTAESKLMKRYEKFRKISPIIFKILILGLLQFLVQCLWAGLTINTAEGMAWATVVVANTSIVVIPSYFLASNMIFIAW